jgi:methyltransferase (TIGR00027 family)
MLRNDETRAAGGVSRTAQYVALYRALESTESARAPLFVDPFAPRFMSRSLAFALWTSRSRLVRPALVGYADARAPGARTSAIARTAYLDDAVRAALAAGTRQLVILGAGFDCRAHRLPELAGARVFEIDRAETQAVKRARLADQRGEVRYVAVDFLRDEVPAALAAAGWSASEATFVLWEGVTNYLTEPAVARVLSWFGSTAPGGAIAFTYVHRGVLDGSVPFEGAATIARNVQRLGEPWTFGLHPDEVAAFVARFGLALREDLGADDYRRRYLGAGPHPGYAFYRVAIADVMPLLG